MASSPKKSGLFSYATLVHAVSGGCGSAVAMSALFPLDTVRTRLQLEQGSKSSNTIKVMAEIYNNEGLLGLYRGILPVIESLYCSNFVYFYTFHGLKRMANQDKSAVRDLLLAMVAGSINVLTTTPLWVVNTRLKMQGVQERGAQNISSQKYRGMYDGLVRVAEEEGLIGLWAGTLSSLILVVNPAIQFMVYEAVKRHIRKHYEEAELNSLVVFGVGAVSKAIATIFTYPIQLVQAKQRHGHKYQDLPEKAGLVQMITYIIRKYGIKGLFKGLEAKLLQTVLTAALMFVCYEKIASVVFTVLMGSNRRHLKH